MAKGKTGGGVGTNQYKVRGNSKADRDSQAAPAAGLLDQLVPVVSTPRHSVMPSAVATLQPESGQLLMSHRPEDRAALINELTGLLHAANPEAARKRLEQWASYPEHQRSRIAPEFIEELLYDLDEVAPSGHYFGAMEGDSAQLGILPNEEVAQPA